MNAYDLQIGIQRKFIELGDSSFFGGFSNINDGYRRRRRRDPQAAVGTFENVNVVTEITGADVSRWYLGYDQAVDAAGTLHLYAVYQHFDADVDLIDFESCPRRGAAGQFPAVLHRRPSRLLKD